MRSVPYDDLTAAARIRDAAMELFAAEGFRATTVRAIAERAGVSPALVLHHYGSKDGLRHACDDHLIGFVRDAKTDAMTAPRMPDIRSYLSEHPEYDVLRAYLLRVLRDGGGAAAYFFDRMSHDVQGYLAVGEAAGTIRPYADPWARAVISTALAFGVLLFEEEIASRLGGTSLADPAVLARYADFTLDLYTHGLLTWPVPRDLPSDVPSAGHPGDDDGGNP